jgi:hypothetical protein
LIDNEVSSDGKVALAPPRQPSLEPDDYEAARTALAGLAPELQGARLTRARELLGDEAPARDVAIAAAGLASTRPNSAVA